MQVTDEFEKKKNEILDVAENLFFTKGYSKTTVSNILEKMKIAKGTFYYYFKSKEEVMDDIINRFVKSEVEKAEKIYHDKRFSSSQKLFKILISLSTKKEIKTNENTENSDKTTNAEISQRSMVSLVKKVTPILEKIVLKGIDEHDFFIGYPKEVVEMLLVYSQIIFDQEIFDWTDQELLEKTMAFVNSTEVLCGAKAGSFYDIIDVIENN